jgi:iron complex outermembrane recepter protein
MSGCPRLLFMDSITRRALSLLLAATALGGAMPAAAQDRHAGLTDLSLEQLANIEITSVSKRTQRLVDVPGSVYVISAEAIRRSGAASLPEVLGLAPNLQVARADANQWAITARGFNAVLANKMLVLIDGRTVYSPLFSGVFWEAQDLLLEDVERIEVLSGSGGTLYGSNAVHGVINIVTRGAADTLGGLAVLGPGSRDQVLAGRFGAATEGGTAWRVWAKRGRRDNTELASGAPLRDSSTRTHAGFRADQARFDSHLTVLGDLYESRIDQAPAARHISGLSLLARYTHTLWQGQAQWQAYIDRAVRDQPGAIDETLDTVDLEFQHESQPLAGHELVWGAGGRIHRDRLTNLDPASLALLPPRRRLHLWNVFAQDEIEWRPGLRLTLGLKAEHNSYTGLEWLPSARIAWEPLPEHLLWAAASRTVRTPARIERDLFTPVIAGGADFDSEVARVYEIGWRGQPRPRLSYALTLFHHDFDRLRSLDPGPAGLTWNNNFSGRLTGLETWGQWRPAEGWRLTAGYLNQRLRVRAAPGTSPLAPSSTLGNDPRYVFKLGSSWDIGPRMELDLHLRRVGALPSPAVPAYTAVDLRWGWRLRPELELSLALRNLTDRRHAEWGVPGSRAEFGRAVFFKAVWRL